MAEKVTKMVLKVVDLQCCRCCKKVKKVLSKFPQIRDQIYEVETNTVIITVVCCNPEKIRDKICCRGDGCIKSTKIIPPQPPTTPPSPPPPPPPPPPPKHCCRECDHGHGGGPCYFCRPTPPPCPCYGTCGRPCCHCWGCTGGPCCGSCGRPFCHCRGCAGGKYCYCSCEGNPEACSIM